MSTVNETYFPELLKMITEDPSAAERLDLECPICKESITINNSNDSPGFDSHDAYVLPCKHIVGLSCAVELIVHDRNTGTTHRCPTCRADLFHSGCGHPNTKGTLLRLSEAWRPAMNISVQDSNRIDEFCTPCYVEFFTYRLTRIAIEEFDFSNFVTDRGVVQLFYKWGEKVFKAKSFPRNTTTIMELPILPCLRNATERAREYLAKLLNVPADKTAELEFHLTLSVIKPAQGPEPLNAIFYLSQREEIQEVAAVLRERPGVSRESIANHSMLRFCRMMTFEQEINARMRSAIIRIHC